MLEQYEAAAIILARAIIKSPSQDINDLFFQTSTISEPLTSLSPWDKNEVALLSSLFPWEGISETIELGIFGTSVGFTYEGEPFIKVYANSRGIEIFSSAISSFEPKNRLWIEFAETEQISFAAAPPVVGGAGIGTVKGPYRGTLGAWIRKSNPSKNFIGISNNHVIANYNKISLGSDIIYCATKRVIGKLNNFVRLKEHLRLDKSSVNLVDFAWFDPCQSIWPTNHIGPYFKSPKGEKSFTQIKNELYQHKHIDVYVCGSSSNMAQGIIAAIQVSVFMQNPDDNKTYHFENQIELNMNKKLSPGDSGALVLTSHNNEIAGILFAIGRDKIGIANPWEFVNQESPLNFTI